MEKSLYHHVVTSTPSKIHIFDVFILKALIRRLISWYISNSSIKKSYHTGKILRIFCWPDFIIELDFWY